MQVAVWLAVMVPAATAAARRPRRYFKYVKEHMLENFEVDTELDCFPIAMPRLVKSVRAAVPDHDSIVCLDNGLYKVRPRCPGAPLTCPPYEA